VYVDAQAREATPHGGFGQFLAHGLGNEATAIALIPIDFGSQAGRQD
jgi:hypothetical protein